MKSALLIVALGSLAAFGQQSTVIGSIDKMTGSDITVKTPRGSITIYAGDRTEVVKDKTYRDFSQLKVSDEISARCEPASSGNLVAIKVWATVVTFSATVRYVNDDEIEVLTIPKSDYGREERRIVRIHAATAFGTSRKDLSVGQRVRVVGLDVGDGAVDAARVALYNTYVPADRERGK